MCKENLPTDLHWKVLHSHRSKINKLIESVAEAENQPEKSGGTALVLGPWFFFVFCFFFSFNAAMVFKVWSIGIVSV